MAEDIYTGYMGIGVFGGKSVRCTDFNANVNQEFGFYNHVIGLNDTTPGGSKTKGENIGNWRTQRTFVKPNPLMIEGSASFPATESNISYFFNFIKTGSFVGDISFYYNCLEGRTFQNARLSSFTLDVTAGDILNITVGFAAKSVFSVGGGTPYKDPEKLLTWDQVSIQVNDLNFSSSDLLKSFTLDAKNPIIPIYTNDPKNAFSDLAPRDLRLGIQEVSGAVTCYNVDGPLALGDCGFPAAPSVINIVAGTFSAFINCLLLPAQVTGSTGPTTTSVGFVGVDKAFG